MLVSNYEITAFDQGNIEKYVETLNSDVDGSVQLIDHVVNILDKIVAKIESKIDKLTKLSVPKVAGTMKQKSMLISENRSFFNSTTLRRNTCSIANIVQTPARMRNGRWSIFKEMVASL